MRALLVATLLLAAATAVAETGLMLSRDAVSSSGGTVEAGDSRLNLTVGQPLTGTSSEGSLAETVGFWGPFVGVGGWTDVPDTLPDLPTSFSLYQNAPNPFGGHTVIRYAIPAAQAGGVRVIFRVFDISGRLVRVLDEGRRLPGVYTAAWDVKSNSGALVHAGVYFYHMEAGGFQAIRRLVVIR